jgi:putative ABC transport system ATP-binding protein
MNPSPIIELRGVNKVFLTEEIETHALADVDFHVGRGEFVSISGPSGCGKSTLMSILGTLDVPTSGSYRLDGNDVAALDDRARARLRCRQLGFVFQAFNLIGDLTIVENVELPLAFRDDIARSARRQRALEALERVGMGHRAKHYPAQLSGGQQQRVAVARALVGSPPILLADEPTGNLDSANGESVMQLLKQLHAGGATVVMVTHDPRYTEWADRQVYMFDGRVVADPPRAVHARSERPGAVVGA